MLSEVERDTLAALQDQIQAQALQLKTPAAGEAALADAQRRLAQHPEAHRRIVRAMRWAAPGVTLANIHPANLAALLAYQPTNPLM